jgi:hypothetical protein
MPPLIAIISIVPPFMVSNPLMSIPHWESIASEPEPLIVSAPGEKMPTPPLLTMLLPFSIIVESAGS